MRQGFELIQTNTTKLLLVMFGSLAVLLLVAFKGGDLLGIAAGSTLEKAWLLGTLGVGVVLLYRSVKAAGALPTLVTVTPDQLLLLKTQTGEETQVSYAQLAAYRASSFNGNEELRLTLADGSRVKVAVSTQLYGEQPFGEMVAAFEAAVGAYPRPADAAQPVVRERSFFEKPVSTYLLVVFTVFLAATVWLLITSDRSVRGGSLIGAVGSYMAYVAAWLAARERRNAV